MTDGTILYLGRNVHQDDYASWIISRVPKAFQVDRLGPDPNGVYSYPPCQVKACDRVSRGKDAALCRKHSRDFERSDKPVQDFIDLAGREPATEHIRPPGLSSQGIFNLVAVESPIVRAELAYGLSERADVRNGHGPARADIFNRLVPALNECGIASLIAMNSTQRKALEVRCGSSWSQARPLLDLSINAIRIERGDGAVKRRIGPRRGGSSRYSRHQEIEQPWLRDLVSRWVDFRLNTEAVTPQEAGQQEAMLVDFASWCLTKHVNSPKDLTRSLLVAWLGHVGQMKNARTGKILSASYRAKFVSSVENFVEVIRVEFGQPVPANARYLRGERPKRSVPNPRFLEPRIIETLRDPRNLEKIPDRAHRLAITIMMSVGMRAGHKCALPFDCLRDLNQGGSREKWAIQFIDTKSKRNMLLPVTPDVAEEIRTFQTMQRRSTGGLTPDLLFFNPRAYKTGQLAPERINVTIRNWVEELDLREPDGSLVRVTPHRFRHTFATEMLEKGVPIEVVKELLGHRNLASTQIYATITDRRLREEWEKSQVVNVRGELVGLPDGPEADAQWLLHRIGRAVQPLPNGFCGLPIQQSCPHANACLDGCDHFMTTKEFLPTLVEQRDRHRRFVSKAEADGHLRIAEINRRPMENLDRIIKTVEESDDES